jgi:hypothetical protein
MTPSHVANDWATITTWLPASSPPTAPWSWREWKSDARFRRTGKVDGSMGLTEAEKVYLSALEAVYPDMRLAREAVHRVTLEEPLEAARRRRRDRRPRGRQRAHLVLTPIIHAIS